MAEYIKVRLDIRNGTSFLYLEIVKQAQKDPSVPKIIAFQCGSVD